MEVTIKSLVYGGNAMGRLEDGRAVFVPFLLPGEKARIRITEERRGYCRGRIEELLESSPERIQPRCPHFGVCGGCHYQHIPYEHQLRLKKTILIEQLERVGGLTNPPVEDVVPSEKPWNYRNHIQFHLNHEGYLGFQAADSHSFVPIKECHLPEAAINQLWPQFELEAGAGLTGLRIRAGLNDDMMLVLEGNDEDPPEFVVEQTLSAAYEGPNGTVVLAGDEVQFMEVSGRSFQVSPASFFQVNSQQAGRMVDHLLSHLPLTQMTTLMDVYCGVGLFSAFLAPHVKRLVGIEASPKACSNFTVNLDEFDSVELFQAEAEQVLSDLDFHADVVVVDPPRSGIARFALEALLRMQPEWIAYISCDPSTLARDAKIILKAGYQIESVTPFDLFPQTYHIESISLFKLTD